jgi:hypothetical protein
VFGNNLVFEEEGVKAMHRRACAVVLMMMLLSGQSSFPQSTKVSKNQSTSPGSSVELARIKELGEAITVLTKIESDPQFTPGAAIKDSLNAQIHQMTCEKNKLLLRQSLSGSAELKESVADTYYAACIQAPEGNTTAGATAVTTAAKSNPPPDVKLPVGCTLLARIRDSFSKNFDTPHPADNSPITVVGPVKAVDRSKQFRLNANSSGGEINTKATVYLEYISRLRYSATLGGVVTPISAPSIPNNIFPSAPTATTKQPSQPAAKAPSGLPPSENSFQQFNGCFETIQEQVGTFQDSLLTEEALLNHARGAILSQLNNLQPVVGTLGEATSVDLGSLPPNIVPPFPFGDFAELREVIGEFILQYAQFKNWAHQSPADGDLYDATSAEAGRLASLLDQYLGSPTNTGHGTPSAATATAPTAAGTTDGTGAPATGGTGKNSVNAGNKGASGSSCPAMATASQEVNDYETNRCFIDFWRGQFRTVAGEAKAGNVDYFIADYKPLCGGFFGQGTSTQMQLTIIDSLNPADKATPINLDKVVCQPALSISSGLGLSFVPDQTPAFVPSATKDAQGNTTIVQSLGYSSQANVRPGYALQVNASLWSPKQSGFEVHWSVGAMLTAANGGVTTDIVTGPTFSFKKRTFYVSPMYDLGLRTTYVPPFAVGMPQGNLTSPPTHQVWKSGFGLTLTFPFGTSTNSTQSSNSSGKAGSAPATDNTGSAANNPPK